MRGIVHSNVPKTSKKTYGRDSGSHQNIENLISEHFIKIKVLQAYVQNLTQDTSTIIL